MARAALLATLLASLAPSFTRAHESSSPHYSNVSGGHSGAAPGRVVAPVSRPRRTPPPAEPAATAAPAAVREPVPAPRPSAWPWAVVLVAVAAAGGVRWRLARREKANGETLAFAAHELRSPLAAIESYLDAMALEAPAAGARVWLEDVQRMKSTAAHLRRTIGDILEMTRLEDGRLKLATRPFSPAALVEECAAVYAAAARARGVALKADVPDGLPAVDADPDRLRQVLDNLVGNALKFTPAGRSVAVSARSGSGRVEIEVRDEGVGVEPAKRARLFGKFARLSPSVDGSEGTGLGLYLSRRMVEAQGGRLSYEPGPGGRGSVFRVELPLREPA